MRENPDYALTDPGEMRRLIRENPWALLVSSPPGRGPVASHVPVLLAVDVDGAISVVSHLGRPDEEQHELGQHEVLIVVQGPHGYVSPSWYAVSPAVPTYNYLAVHLHGRPEILSDEENLEVLAATVDRFEQVRDAPFRMADVSEYAARLAGGTVGFRVTASRVEAKAKLSQDKPPEVVDRVISALESDPYHAQPALAAEVRRRHGRPTGPTRGGEA